MSESEWAELKLSCLSLSNAIHSYSHNWSEIRGSLMSALCALQFVCVWWCCFLFSFHPLLSSFSSQGNANGQSEFGERKSRWCYQHPCCMRERGKSKRVREQVHPLMILVLVLFFFSLSAGDCVMPWDGSLFSLLLALFNPLPALLLVTGAFMLLLVLFLCPGWCSSWCWCFCKMHKLHLNLFRPVWSVSCMDANDCKWKYEHWKREKEKWERRHRV